MLRVRLNTTILFLIFILCSLVMLYIRQSIGYKTPDELNFYFNNYISCMSNIGFGFISTNDALSLKYYISSLIFQFFIQFGEIYLYLFNIFVVSITFYISYNAFVIKYKIIHWAIWSSLFFLPNILFFTNSLLRDVYIFVLVVLFLIVYKNNESLSLKLLIILVLIFLLRPELAVIICISYFITSLNKNSHKNIAVAGFLFLSFLFMLFLYMKTDYYQNKIFKNILLNNNIGVWGFDPENINLPLLLLSNAALFFFPITNNFFLTSRFGNLLLITAFINFYFIFIIFFRYGFSYNTTDKTKNFIALCLVLSIPIFANETDSLSAARHVIYYLPFLFMYFGLCKFRLSKKRGTTGGSDRFLSLSESRASSFNSGALQKRCSGLHPMS